MKTVRLILAAVIAAFSAVPSLALGVAHENITVRPDREDGLYSAGDTARIFARCDRDLGPLRLLVIENRDTIVNRVMEFAVDSTYMIFSEVCTVPKGVMAILGPDGDDAHVTSAGYVVGHDIIKPGFDAPSDLYSWWEGEIRSMRKHRPKVTCVPAEVPDKYRDSGVRCWHVSITMHEGPNVEAYVAMPVKAAKRSLPIIVKTHGATAINSKSTRSNLNVACKYAAKGAIAADINALGILDNEPQAYYDSLARGPLKGYNKRPLTDRKGMYFRLMFLRLERLLDYLCAFKEWDRTRVMAHGGSQGGAQALFLAGVDKRLSHCVAMVPAMTDFGGTLAGRAAAWPMPYAAPGVAASDKGQDILRYYDTALLVNRFKGKLYLEAGFIDTTCPSTCIYATYNNAVSASEKTIMPYVYRRHCCVDPPYNAHWKSTVVAARDKFLEDYLK